MVTRSCTSTLLLLYLAPRVLILQILRFTSHCKKYYTSSHASCRPLLFCLLEISYLKLGQKFSNHPIAGRSSSLTPFLISLTWHCIPPVIHLYHFKFYIRLSYQFMTPCLNTFKLYVKGVHGLFVHNKSLSLQCRSRQI